MINALNLSGILGHEIATVNAFEITRDSSIDIEFQYVLQNPLMHAIEIVSVGDPRLTVEAPMFSRRDFNSA